MSSYTVEAVLKASGVSGFQKAFANAEQSMEGFKKVGGQLTDIGKNLTKKVTLPIVAMGGMAIKTGMEFEKSMSSVKAISGATGQDLQDLEDIAREMGKNTAFSASEAAEGLEYMALAGWDNKTMVESLPSVLKLASAGSLDLGRASDLVTDSMSAMGVESKDLSGYLDVVAKAAASSNTDIDALMEAYVGVGGVLRGLDVPVESSAVALGMLANAGIKGSEAGNSLSAVLTNLTAPTGRAKDALDELGFSAFDSEGNFKGLDEVLFELDGSMEGMSTEQQNMYKAMIGGKGNIDTINALLNGLDDSYDELTDAIGDSEGALTEMEEAMTDNLQGSIDGMMSSLGELGISFYQMADGPIRKLVDAIAGIIDWFSELSDETKQWMIIAGGIAAALGPAIWAVGALASGIAGLPATMLLLSGPVGAIIAGIVAVIAIGALMIANWDEIKNAGKAMMDLLIPEFGLLTDAVKKIWETIKESFSAGNFEEVALQFSVMITLILGAIADGLPHLMEAGFEMITNIIEGITTKIPEFLAKGLEMMVLFATILADALPKLLRLGMDFVVSLLKGLGDKVPDWIRMGVEMVVKMAQTLGDNLPKIIAKGGEMLASAAKGFRDKFPEIVAAGFEMIAKLLGAILENLPKLVAAGLELIVKLAVGIIKAIPNVLRAMADITRGITGAVKNISLVGAGRAVIRGFIDGMKAMWESGKKWVKGIGTWIKDNKGPISYDRKLLTPAGNAIISGLNKGLEDSFPDVQRTVSGMAGAIQDSFTSNPTMAINGNIARSNGQIQSAVSHEINNNHTKQPAQISLRLGNRDYRAFVGDISNTQSQSIQFEESYSL